MFHSITTLKAVGATLAAVITLGFDNPVAAGPPEGLRYSDLQNRTGWFANRSTPSAPRYSGYAPSFYAPSDFTPSVVSPSTVTSTPAQETVVIRGPDGVVRTYPVVGGVQQAVPTTVFLRGSDGVVRSYPVVNGMAPVVSESGVVTHPCHPDKK